MGVTGGAGRALRCAWIAAVVAACQAHVAAVSMRMTRAESTPRDASVYIDEEFVGFLGVVQARGVRLPEGEHRITVERDGYFPWDQLVISDRTPIALHVALVPIPD
jgi:PEGA domain-containing protein